MLTAGVLAISGIAPAALEARLEAANLARWLRPVATPVRISLAPNAAANATALTPLRLTLATAGHDLHCLVATGGGVDADAVARAAARHLGHPVTAAPVTARDPREEAYRPTVLLRVPPGASCRPPAPKAACSTTSS